MSFTYLDYETVSLNGNRIYHISDDQLYPSITTVLGGTQPEEKTSALAQWKARVGAAKANQVSNDAATRGTNVHLMLERFVNGEDPQLETFPHAHSAIFKSLRLELRKINKVYGQEVVLYSDTLGVAGRCDLVAEYQGELSIVDYKTSSRVKSAAEITDYFLQAQFYALAHNEMFGTNITKLVILMGIENKLPMVFKQQTDDDKLVELVNRASKFYEKFK